MLTDLIMSQRAMRIDRLQVIFKVAERCNINCDYCYYFNMGEESARDRPALARLRVAEQLADWLARGCRELSIGRLSVSFHGGEPFMLGARRFAAICEALTRRLRDQADLQLNVQTNGTILSETWLDLLCRQRIHVGVSLDGDRAAHDRHRLDRRGRSTFARTEAALKALVARGRESGAPIGPATISVLDYRNDHRALYRYLRGLGVRRMSFLLPDRSHEDGFTGDGETAECYGAALAEIFESWLLEDDPGVHVRFISEFLQHFQVWQEGPAHAGPPPDPAVPRRATQIIVVHSDGRIGVSDSYIPALAWFRKAPERSIRDTSLAAFLREPVFDEIEATTARLAAPCRRCGWKSLCRGGDLENRYSRARGFDNPSVYCGGYLDFYDRACALLLRNGYPEDRLRAALAA